MAYKNRLRELPVDINPRHDLAVLDSGQLFLAHPFVRRFLLFWTSGYTLSLSAGRRRQRRLCDDPADHIGERQDLGFVRQLEQLIQAVYWKFQNTQLSRYPYEELSEGHIRLLRIVPGKEGTELGTLISTVRLDASVPFETLSYTWGGSQTRFVRCGAYSLTVTENLFRALHVLRSEHEERVFWIDAVCINQSDKDEKTKQIKLMREIYATSQSTTVWLGTIVRLPSPTNDLMNSLIQFGHDRDAMPKVERDRAVWAPLLQLFTDPWFSRMWIIQEVSVSHDIVVLIQTQSWPWNDFVLAAQMARIYAQKSQTIFEPDNLIRLANIREMFEQGKLTDVLQILLRTRCSASTEDRDKINAVLGLTGIPFEPDVTGTASEMFIRFATHIIRTSPQRMMLLNLICDRIYSLKTSLPSWVPDWEIRYGPKPFASWPIFYKWRAGGDQESTLNVSPDSRRLHVRGFVLDHIQHVGLAYRETLPPTDSQQASEGDRRVSRNNARKILQSLRRSQQWYDIAMNYGSMYKDKQARYHAYLLTLIAGSGPEFASQEEDVFQLAQGFRTWYSMAARGLEDDREAVRAWAKSIEMTDRDAIGRGMTFITETIRYAWGRRFFASRDLGMVGLCPSLVRRGDLVVILHGGQTPYALRHVRGGKYKLLGECYAHDFMHGEALDMREANQIVDFELI